MLKNKTAQTLLLLLLFIITFAFGARVAYNIALKRIDTKYQIAFKDKIITDIKFKFHILNSLRTNDNVKATKALEDYLDNDLSSLADYVLLQKTSDKEIEKIANAVKLYRDKYNDHKVNPGNEHKINDLLNKYK